jgi:hypothetical protein
LVGHDLTYSVFYSPFLGAEEWFLLETDVTSLFYMWDSATVIEWNEDVYFKIEVSCIDGTWVMDEQTDYGITIDNQHYLHTYIVSPLEGEVLHGSETINWTVAEDEFNHSVTYILSYSPDNGDTWVILGSGLQTTHYLWDTSTVADGQYLVRVEARCSAGTSSMWSARTFTINNHQHLQSFSLLSPQGGERLSDLIQIQWEVAEDLFQHEVLYTLSYSADLGIHWITLALNLNRTSYSWDSTLVDDGLHYLIRVNASCSEGSWLIATSAAFAIENNPLASSLPESSVHISSPSFNLIPVFQILGLGSILIFIVTVVLVIRQQRA